MERMWKYVLSAISFVSGAVGLAGVPAHLKVWAKWIDMIDYAVLWYGLAVTGLVVALGMAVRDGMQARVRHFDVPILDAINYLARTIPHSYRDSGSAGRHFFGLLHSEMCAGNLPVVGMKGESSTPRRISARQCKRLTPTDVVVPLNPSTPHGVRYSLVNWPVEFLGLRVRTRDVYRIWPRGIGGSELQVDPSA